MMKKLFIRFLINVVFTTGVQFAVSYYYNIGLVTANAYDRILIACVIHVVYTGVKTIIAISKIKYPGETQEA